MKTQPQPPLVRAIELGLHKRRRQDWTGGFGVLLGAFANDNSVEPVGRAA